MTRRAQLKHKHRFTFSCRRKWSRWSCRWGWCWWPTCQPLFRRSSPVRPRRDRSWRRGKVRRQWAKSTSTAWIQRASVRSRLLSFLVFDALLTKLEQVVSYIMSPKNFCEAQARAWRKEGVGGRNSATPERSAERSEAVMSDFAFWICVSGLAKWFQKHAPLGACSPAGLGERTLSSSKNEFVSLNLAPRVGLEPTTLSLTARRSTIELPRNNMVVSQPVLLYHLIIGFQLSWQACNSTSFSRIWHLR